MALYVYYFNITRNLGTSQGILETVFEFNNLKAVLIKNNYLNRKFFLKLILEKKNIKNFYGSNMKLVLKQSVGFYLILSSAIFGTLAFSPVTQNIRNDIFSKSGLISGRSQTSKPQFPNFVFSPFRTLNTRGRIIIPAKNSNIDLDSLMPPGSILMNSSNSIEITKHSVFVRN